MSGRPRIALVHATPLAIEPAAKALARNWPEAEAVNILDDSLSTDRARSTELTERLASRIRGLAQYARSLEATAILFTCSAFGTAIEAASHDGHQPVLKPNEAMFEAAIKTGRNIAMLYTFAPAADGMVKEFEEEAVRAASPATLTLVFVDGAIDALRQGDMKGHNDRLVQAATSLSGYDAVLLAHFSTSCALQSIRAVISTPVYSAPDTAVLSIRKRLESRDIA